MKTRAAVAFAAGCSKPADTTAPGTTNTTTELSSLELTILTHGITNLITYLVFICSKIIS